jgi:hypothetical protein
MANLKLLNETGPDEKTSVDVREIPLKRYEKPVLEELGDVRTLTLGVSPGAGDSLNPGFRRP